MTKSHDKDVKDTVQMKKEVLDDRQWEDRLRLRQLRVLKQVGSLLDLAPLGHHLCM